MLMQTLDSILAVAVILVLVELLRIKERLAVGRIPA